MKKNIILLTFCFIFMLFGCSNSKESGDKPTSEAAIVDVRGNSAVLPEDARVVCAYGSFSECWLLSGGELVGVTDDAIKERKLDLPQSVEVIGTVKDVSLEKIVSLSPDYVILSADIAAHSSLESTLSRLGIQYGYFRVDSFEDYKELMKQFCAYNQREDLYKKNVTDIEAQIELIKASVSKNSDKTYLLMRVYSTGIKVKTDNIADVIIKDLGGVSITDTAPSLLSDFSVEEIIKTEPRYIFVLTMGDESAGEKYFEENIVKNPAWSGLDAIKNGNYHILPKALFHYKPNNRWAESYRYIADILYPKAENNDK